MRRCLAGISNCVVGGLLVLIPVLVPSWSNIARSDPSGSDRPATCNSDELVIEQSAQAADREWACAAASRTPEEVAQARAYLIATASPGYTMTLQGAELAIGRLHPEFAVRLEHAIREARSAGLPSASIFSAYRPPAFGVGGFHDKFNSLHTYGLAVDMRGIGAPGSPEAQRWHEIAARNGVVCPYGPYDRAEWNHCQPTSIKIVRRDNPLRNTVSSTGPLELDVMFEVGDRLIDDMASAAESLSRAASTPVHVLEAAARPENSAPHVVASRAKRPTVRMAARRISANPVRHAKLTRHVGATAARQRHT
jgi:hypothetical protein